MERREKLILDDLIERFVDVGVDPKFLRLYGDGNVTDKMFAYFHQSLNSYFTFMNSKIDVNRHFNANESRELIWLIQEIREAQELLAEVALPFAISDYYGMRLGECEQFLEISGGSNIPEDFEKIKLSIYDRVFYHPASEVSLPKRQAKYDLKIIGSGSYANVYRFLDPDYGIWFALKRAKRDLSPKDMERFRREFDLLSKLNYPYVLKAYRYDDERNQYTMECCDSTLRQYISRNNANLQLGARKRIALQLLYGLNYLHRQGHLHRDLSYQNVLVKEFDGSAVIVKISDFGLYKDRTSDLTRTESELRGTIIDPTLKSFKDFNVLNEIYSIGFIISFIFSGRQDINACSGVVGEIVKKCVAYEPSSRYQEVISIINCLEELQTD